MSFLIDIKEIEKQYNFLFEEKRVATFKKWIFKDDVPCNALKMAEAGFIFIGNKREPDAVMCVFCEKHLDGWEEMDDPWAEHLQHAPHCEFAKLNTPENGLTIIQFLRFKEKFLYNLVTKAYEKEIKNIEDFDAECQL